MNSPDALVFGQLGPLALSATLVYTWALMALLVFGSWLVTRRLSTGVELSAWQNLLEVLVDAIRDQIREVSRQSPDPYLPFVGSLFVFIAASNLLAIIPGYLPPTASLSTTTALAIAVFIAVPVFGVAREGFGAYLRHYLRPSFFMLPFNIIGEVSRTIALAVRLYGNIMSGSVIAALLLSLVPFFVPILIQLFGLLIGMVQAYIFAVLAMVYIASATAVRRGGGDAGDGVDEHEDAAESANPDAQGSAIGDENG
jgi:F-type H+-transporting ATPase subunit a